jgi:hypothetical protein
MGQNAAVKSKKCHLRIGNISMYSITLILISRETGGRGVTKVTIDSNQLVKNNKKEKERKKREEEEMMNEEERKRREKNEVLINKTYCRLMLTC